MKLSEFIAASGKSASDFAREIDVPPSTVTRWLNGERSPSLDMMRRIIAATNGAVTADDLIAAAPDADAASDKEAA